MRSTGDLTAAAQIRDAALVLFAERGVAAVSIRDIAAAAAVSPALVMHHYGSRDGLRAAVDEWVAAAMAQLLTEGIEPPGRAAEAGTMAAVIAARFADAPAVPGYLRRLLVDGGEPARQLFRALFEASVAALRHAEAAGVVRPGIAADPVRTAVLLANDMALLLLRDQLADVVGFDPLAADGLERWSAAVLDLYTAGVLLPGRRP